MSELRTLLLPLEGMLAHCKSPYPHPPPLPDFIRSPRLHDIELGLGLRSFKVQYMQSNSYWKTASPWSEVHHLKNFLFVLVAVLLVYLQIYSDLFACRKYSLIVVAISSLIKLKLIKPQSSQHYSGVSQTILVYFYMQLPSLFIKMPVRQNKICSIWHSENYLHLADHGAGHSYLH